MAAETSELRTLARRVKQKALEKALDVFEHPDNYTAEVVNETFLKVLGNAVPRTQEISGEDGGDVKVAITGINYIVPQTNEQLIQEGLDEVFKDTNGNHDKTGG